MRYLAGPGMAGSASLAERGVLAVGAWDVIGLLGYRAGLYAAGPLDPAGAPRHLYHRECAAGGIGGRRPLSLRLHLHAAEVRGRHRLAGAAGGSGVRASLNMSDG